jgi:hypothetical protein
MCNGGWSTNNICNCPKDVVVNRVVDVEVVRENNKHEKEMCLVRHAQKIEEISTERLMQVNNMESLRITEAARTERVQAEYNTKVEISKINSDNNIKFKELSNLASKEITTSNNLAMVENNKSNNEAKVIIDRQKRDYNSTKLPLVQAQAIAMKKLETECKVTEKKLETECKVTEFKEIHKPQTEMIHSHQRQNKLDDANILEMKYNRYRGISSYRVYCVGFPIFLFAVLYQYRTEKLVANPTETVILLCSILFATIVTASSISRNYKV